MRKPTRQLCAILLAAVTALALAACGSSKSSSSSSSGGGQASGAKEGGSVTGAFSAQPDFLDPALGTTVAAAETMWTVYTPLVTYKHVEGQGGTQIIPGLAQSLPTISKDGKTYTFMLRKGITYSDGTPVKASDFKHEIKRVLNLGSGWASYAEIIQGAKAYEKAKNPNADISGITTDDATGKITIKLTGPKGEFLNRMAQLWSAPVPSSTPFKDQTKNPPPGVGAFKITSSQPNRQFVMTKNTRFNLPGIPKAHLDQITIKIVPNQSQEAEQVLSNQLDYMDDPPPPDVLQQVKAKAQGRFRTVNTVSTYYMFMNDRLKPFNSLQVREAVNYALDKTALARLFGGLFTPGCNFLPQGMPGYQKVSPCPWGDPNGKPDLAKAKALVKQSGTAGTAITVWSDNKTPSDKIAQYYADLLNQLGFKATPKIIDAGVYFTTIENQKTKAQTGFTDWFEDYPHPGDFFQLVNGESITPTNNQNLGNVNDPYLNKQIDKLSAAPKLEAVTSQWAALDKYLVSKAWIAPYGQRQLTVFQSSRMNPKCSIFNTTYQTDFSSWCLK